jgi:hypothetical protein
MIYHYGTGFRILANSLDRADIGAICVAALVTNRWKMVEVFLCMPDFNKSAVGIVASQHLLAAGQLANTATCAKIKIGFNKHLLGHGNLYTPLLSDISTRGCF